MKDPDKVAHRLALLEEVGLFPADLESIVTEIEDLERVMAELEEFSQGTPWISLQAQPAGSYQSATDWHTRRPPLIETAKV